ncbi:hypothetical protein E3T34_07780 [Cryobacterium sp. TMT1-62]|uniref:DUF7657 domain-containing protein n=1 Tax=Cryobacterium sp. TMT1-62 TaxID=1259240 RepID=UPI001068EA6B|nr:hypothetical protein [Cryobacterium sp. TMT1-62]TFD32754.1 hypothetical protein E3T34_07780 [Cryobacterium sp. TMT1-62]
MSRLIQPTRFGLPSLFVSLWFPALLLIAFILLVAFAVSGSSTGVYWSYFGTGQDPSLLLGEPRPIRSDEWLVQSSWVASQYQQGFGVFNQTLPGGMDATVQNDLPTMDWSSIFRPHLLGLLALPFDQGMAVRWWLPAFVMVGACYSFAVSLLPKHPLSAALLSGALFLTPVIQWWFLPTTIWPVALAFLGMTGTVWMLRHPALWVRVGWAAAIAYVAVATAMSIYAPFIVPAALVVVFFLIGFSLSEARSQSVSFQTVLLRLLPLIAAGLGAGAVLSIWIVTRIETIQALLGTVYPGQRFEKTGTVGFEGLIGLMGGPFDQALLNQGVNGLGANQSEASSVLMIALFMVIPLVWLITQQWSENRVVDWLAVSIVTCTMVILAFMFLPGWDSLAHVMFLDRSSASRMRLGLAILGIVAIVVTSERLQSARVRILPWSVSWVASGAVILSVVVPWAYLRTAAPDTIALSPSWKIATLLLMICVVLFTRARLLAGSAAFLLAASIIGLGVNPLYVGVFRLNETAVGTAVQEIDLREPGTWVGIGSVVPTAVLVQAGVEAMNGVQTYPPEEMWDEIDPSGKYEGVWNRLANVGWEPGVGEPSVSTPVRDQIRITFDSCSSFGQKHVDYVLTDVPLDQECAVLIDDFTEGPSQHFIYRVTPG